ncbi:porin family protein [Steroidobacter cummioxidans]|uniref:porin family protein n=1 Tax=Steroidobacter cummioxidans TaxID=1803913 RepID=UPI000E3199C9|nr:porin family protein [Steroidobacter cummioxidans]
MQKQLATGIALAFVCLPAMAESEIGFYSGVGVGQVTLKDNIDGVGIKATGTGFKIFGGYRFNEYGSLEVAYLDAGSPDDRVGGVRIESDATAIQGSAILHIPISLRFEGFARAGFVVWDAENTARGAGFSFTQKNDGTDFALGIGAAWHVTPRFGLRAEFEGAELDGTDLRSLSISGLFSF